MTDIHTTIDGLRAALAPHRADGRRIVLVPTMGALHAGHLALVRHARSVGDVVVVSIFVNPLQFGPSEDLDRYPRTLDADIVALDALVDLVFAPSATEMYPEGAGGTMIAAGDVGTLYEGASRTGHFDGMLTVVAKLFNIVQPAAAVFGQKDAQQVFLVRRMVRDLDLPVTIEVEPTVREEDGLALSSRNRYLDASDRRAAVMLSAALTDASDAASRGTAAAREAARMRLEPEQAVKLDYLVIVDPATFLPVADDYRGPASMLIAARVGTTRLIDNASLQLG
jgi:pantoate--beta-alanine ligase